MRTLGDCFGIKLMCFAAEAPWSKDLCERLNYILVISVKKIMDDTLFQLDVALSWQLLLGIHFIM